MDGTNQAQVALLDLNAELFLGETFAHKGVGGILWTLVPSDDTGYQGALVEGMMRHPRYRAMAQSAMHSGILQQHLEGADASIQGLVDLIVGTNGDKQRIDDGAAMQGILAQYNRSLDSARQEADKTMDGVDVLSVMDDQKILARTAVANHLVVKVEKVPAQVACCADKHEWPGPEDACPECSGPPVGERVTKLIGGGGELALQLFGHPGFGPRIMSDVVDACDKAAKASAAAIEEHSKNSEPASAGLLK